MKAPALATPLTLTESSARSVWEIHDADGFTVLEVRVIGPTEGGHHRNGRPFGSEPRELIDAVNRIAEVERERNNWKLLAETAAKRDADLVQKARDLAAQAQALAKSLRMAEDALNAAQAGYTTEHDQSRRVRSAEVLVRYRDSVRVTLAAWAALERGK